MAKAQAHFRLEPDLLEAIKVKAEEEKVTVTDLVTRFLIQGLGLDTHSDIQSVDQTKIEESVYQRVSTCITTQLSELEESMLKRIAVRISDLNDDWEKHISERIISQFTELEERVSSLSNTWEEKILESAKSRESELEKRILERIATSVSNLETNWEKRISDCITKPKLNKEKILDTQNRERIPEKNTADILNESEPQSISKSVSPVYTEKPEEIQPENKTLTLFSTELNEQILNPGKIAILLNENTNPKNWSIHKLKNLRLRQLTWIKNYKNPDKKTKGKPTLPLIVEKYLIDWVISDEDEEKSTGKKWWIKELPSDEAEIETLIKEREAKYITYYFGDTV